MPRSARFRTRACGCREAAFVGRPNRITAVGRSCEHRRPRDRADDASALDESQRIVQDQHAASTLAGLLALSKAQQLAAGRKIIVFFPRGCALIQIRRACRARWCRRESRRVTSTPSTRRGRRESVRHVDHDVPTIGRPTPQSTVVESEIADRHVCQPGCSPDGFDGILDSGCPVNVQRG